MKGIKFIALFFFSFLFTCTFYCILHKENNYYGFSPTFIRESVYSCIHCIALNLKITFEMLRQEKTCYKWQKYDRLINFLRFPMSFLKGSYFTFDAVFYSVRKVSQRILTITFNNKLEKQYS